MPKATFEVAGSGLAFHQLACGLTKEVFIVYKYKMIQVPSIIEMSGGGRGNEASAYLENIVNSNAAEGWEFHRVDEIGVRDTPGCLAGLLGAKSTTATCYVITFRRQK